jgi:hypothetical protein
MRAQEFFTKHVEPAIAEWRANDCDERLAMNAAVALNQMADHYFHSLPTGDPRLLAASSVRTLRDELGKQEPAFALIRDVADAHKHVKLDRKDRQVSSAEQTTVGSLGWGEAEFSYGRWGGAAELVVTLDSGRKRHFSALVDATFTMWKRLLEASALP